MRRWSAAAIAAVLWLGCGGLARAEDYPTRAITMIVPFPRGRRHQRAGAVPGREDAGDPGTTDCDRECRGCGRLAASPLFAELGIDITPHDQQSPEALRAYQKAEAERWWPIIKAVNIKVE
jgi:hypothetical protein